MKTNKLPLGQLTLLCGENLKEESIEELDRPKDEHLMIFMFPEKNKHPVEHVRLAKEIVAATNKGQRIVVLTYSDYIVKEINTMCMLNSRKPHIRKVAKENGYMTKHKLSRTKVKAYDFRDEIVECDINKYGMAVPSFDNVIDRMNQIQEDIVWGEE